MEDITKYDLKKEEFKECLNKATMEMLIGAKPSKDPESILIIAQPGAGKTGLRRFVEKEKKEKEGRENYVDSGYFRWIIWGNKKRKLCRN